MKLRYLHLSDLHLSYSEMKGDDWAATAFNQDIVVRSMIDKIGELARSIRGFFEDHHRFQLILLMGTITDFENRIAETTERLERLTAPCQDILERLDEIPGTDKVSAQSIPGEIGVTLDEFISMAALASWAGLCPGNNESAGKRKSCGNSVFGHPFKTILIEVAWAAVKKWGSHYREKYYRLKARRGAKKADFKGDLSDCQKWGFLQRARRGPAQSFEQRAGRGQIGETCKKTRIRSGSGRGLISIEFSCGIESP